ncbi:MAG: hypothetical protein AAF587_44725, partial [Bacteroidota bacterium]
KMKKLSREKLIEKILFGKESGEALFNVLTAEHCRKYLDSQGYQGLEDCPPSQTRQAALSLAAHLYKRSVVKTMRKDGREVELPKIAHCKRCIDKKHSPAKCKITQFWVKQGLPLTSVAPEAAPNRPTSIQIAKDEAGIVKMKPSVLNSRQKRARRREEWKYRTWNNLTDKELRQLHWEVSQSKSCMTLAQSYLRSLGLKKIPSNLRELASNVHFHALEKNSPNPNVPMENSASQRAPPIILLKEVNYISLGFISDPKTYGDWDKLPGLREKFKTRGNITEHQLYDPAEVKEVSESSWHFKSEDISHENSEVLNEAVEGGTDSSGEVELSDTEHSTPSQASNSPTPHVVLVDAGTQTEESISPVVEFNVWKEDVYYNVENMGKKVRFSDWEDEDSWRFFLKKCVDKEYNQLREDKLIALFRDLRQWKQGKWEPDVALYERMKKDDVPRKIREGISMCAHAQMLRWRCEQLDLPFPESQAESPS